MRQRMRPTLLGLGLVALSACSSPTSEKRATAFPPQATFPPSAAKHLQQVRGSFVSFGILTFVGISCSAYERQFATATPFVLLDPARLRAIERRLALLQPDTMHLGVDARAKAVLVYNDRTRDTLCMDQFISVYRGRNFRADTLLYQLLGVRPDE